MKEQYLKQLGILTLIFLGLLGCRAVPPANSANTATTNTPAKLNHLTCAWDLSDDPENPIYDISRVLTEHPEWGKCIGQQYEGFCASGTKYRMILQKPGKKVQDDVLFYVRAGKVIAVYQDRANVRVLGEKVPYRLMTPRKGTPTDESLPPYTIYADVQIYRTPERFGEVVVPSLTAKTPSAERERIAKSIAKREGFSALYLYHSKRGWYANQAQPITAYALLRSELIGKLYGDYFNAEPGLW